VEQCQEVNIGLTPELYNLLAYYFDEVRKRVKIPLEHDFMFFTRTGDPMKTDMLAKIVNQVYSKCGVTKTINCTNLRKMASTSVNMLVCFKILTLLFKIFVMGRWSIKYYICLDLSVTSGRCT